MATYLEYVESEIRKDFAAFADPGTTVKIVHSGTGMVARWVQNDNKREVFLSRNHEDFPSVDIGGRKLNYRSFLASEYMADLKRLAGTIARIGYEVKDFVETRASVETPDEAGVGASEKATDLIRKLGTESPPLGCYPSRIRQGGSWLREDVRPKETG